jgi:hypothetical protein
MTILPKLLTKFLVLFNAKINLIAMWDRDPVATILISVPIDLSDEHGQKLVRLLMGVSP